MPVHVQLTHSDVLSFDAKGPVRRLADVSAGTRGESLTKFRILYKYKLCSYSKFKGSVSRIYTEI